ncbi:hypothetical protein HMPREF9996_01473, partial [Aggregatibacter actinomycetemcomitans Y4]
GLDKNSAVVFLSIFWPHFSFSSLLQISQKSPYPIKNLKNVI